LVRTPDDSVVVCVVNRLGHEFLVGKVLGHPFRLDVEPGDGSNLEGIIKERPLEDLDLAFHSVYVGQVPAKRQKIEARSEAP